MPIEVTRRDPFTVVVKPGREGMSQGAMGSLASVTVEMVASDQPASGEVAGKPGQQSMHLQLPRDPKIIDLEEGVAAASRGLDSLFRVRVVAAYELNWPDFADAPPVGAGGYWYPQGFAYDDAGWRLSHLAGRNQIGPAVGIVIVQDETQAYRGWFKVSAGGESILVSGSFEAGNLVIDKKGSGTIFVRHAIGSLPAKGADCTAQTILVPSGCQTQYAREGDLTIIQQSTPDLGLTTSRQKWRTFDADMNPIGDVFFPLPVMGVQLNDNDIYEHIPKSQGVAMRGGHVFVATGGSWLPSDVPIAPRVADYGIAVLALDGSLLDYAVLDAQKLFDWLTAEGYSPVKIESEGCAFHPNGELHTLCVTRRPSSPDASTYGILILSHGDRKGQDLKQLRARYTPRNMLIEATGMLPRGVSNEYRHPQTNVVIDTMQDLLTMMSVEQMTRAAWFSAALNIAPLPGMTLPPIGESYVVDVKYNINNSTFRVSTHHTSAAPYTVDEYQVFQSGGVWTVRKVKPDMGAIDPDRISGALVGFTTFTGQRAAEALARVQDGAGRMRVLEIGDSTTRGNGASNKTRARPAMLAGLLTAQGLSVNTQCIMSSGGMTTTAAIASYDPTVTFGADWEVGSSWTVGGPRLQCPANATEMVWTPSAVVDRFQLFYGTGSANGILEYSIDAGATWTEINQYSASNGFSNTTIVVTKGTNVLRLRRKSGGTVNVCQILAWDSTTPSIDLFNAGWSGVSSYEWSFAGAPWSPLNVIGALAPDLTVINLTINSGDLADAPGDDNSNFETNFKARMQAIIKAALVSGDVWLMIGVPSSPTSRPADNQRKIRSYVYELARANGLPVIDLTVAFRSYANAAALNAMADTLHPSNYGYLLAAQVEAAAFGRLLTFGRGGSQQTLITDTDKASTPPNTASVETVLKTIFIPGSLGKRGLLEVMSELTLTAGSTTPREFKFYINGILVRRLTSSAGLTSGTASYLDQFYMLNKGSETSQAMHAQSAASPFAGTGGAPQSPSIDTTAGLTLTIAAIPSLNTDTFSVDTVIVRKTVAQ